MGTRSLEERRSKTVRRIFDAAKEIFAEVGFAGARIDEIARRAGVNKATIYYRIGEKRALYAGVLHDVFADTATSISLNLAETDDPVEKLKKYIGNVARTADQNPWVPHIMMRELASGGQNLPDVVAEDFIRILGILRGILQEGVERGLFIDVNPLLVHWMILGPVISHRSMDSVRARCAGMSGQAGKLDAGLPRELAKEVAHLVLRAVKR
ncbi:MAG: TetR/AcrR family transcriptional regulator [Pseudomonadota bacterium]